MKQQNQKYKTYDHTYRDENNKNINVFKFNLRIVKWKFPQILTRFRQITVKILQFYY